MPARTTTTPMTMRAMAALLMAVLEVEDLVDALAPRVDEVEALAAEERADDDKDGPEHHEDGEQGDGELAVLGLVARILVEVARGAQPDESETGDGDARHHGVEHREQFLQTEEVPGRLRRVGREVEVRRRQEWGVDEGGENQQEGGHGQAGDELG